MKTMPHLAYWQKVLYASGSLATTVSYQAFGTYIQFFYIDILGLKASLVGLGWSLYGVWNAINDPLAGHLSDHTRTRWGRRIPWIATMFIPAALFFYLLWVPPSPLVAGKGIPLFVYFMAIVLTFDLLWTIVVMNWTSLFPEMIPGEKERATVSGWRQVFSLIGLLIGVGLPPILVGEDWSRRGSMALLLAFLTAFWFGASLLGSKERREFSREPALPLRQALRATFANVSFRYFMIANLAKEFIYSMLTATAPFYTKYALQIQEAVRVGPVTLDVGMQTSLFLGITFLAALPAIPVWTAITKRVGAHRAWKIACLTFSTTILYFLFAGDFFAGILGTAVLGLSLAGLLILPDLLIAAVIDEDELVTGVRREGMFFGINGFIIRFAFSLQGIVTAAVLTLTGYVHPTGEALYPVQPLSAVWGIRGMMTLVPIAAMGITYWALSRFPLHGARLAEVQREVAALHAQKAERIAAGPDY